ncbi:MAG: phosphatase PAP2 family protein [Oscillospiraceae bacterium]|nr:phosphatase PAP2 family protein [Oscillospiraceae bacterium]
MLEAILTLDSSILLWIQDFLRNDLLSAFFTTYTHLADNGELWIAVCVLFLLFRKTRPAGIVGLLSLLTAHLVNTELLKNIIARPRPFTRLEELECLIKQPSSYSFPSGHSSASFAAAGAWLQTLSGEKWMAPFKVLAVIMALLMAFSRLYVGVHYPTDVIAGSLMGFLASVVVTRIYRKVSYRLSYRPHR